MSRENGNGGPKLLVAPTEPKALRDLGKVSLATEENGVDIMWASRGGLWGIQRKEVGDLLSSVTDGRLSKELAQMQAIEQAILVVEGRLHWTGEGELLGEYGNMTRRGFHGMLWSVRQRGVWVEFTTNLEHTMDVVRWLADWSRKERHSGLRNRPGPQTTWGHITDREWGIHLLCGMDGIGPGMAAAIFDHFGSVPMKWTVTPEELQQVKGIGPKRAGQMVRALERKVQA